MFRKERGDMSACFSCGWGLFYCGAVAPPNGEPSCSDSFAGLLLENAVSGLFTWRFKFGGGMREVFVRVVDF